MIKILPTLQIYHAFDMLRMFTLNINCFANFQLHNLAVHLPTGSLLAAHTSVLLLLPWLLPQSSEFDTSAQPLSVSCSDVTLTSPSDVIRPPVYGAACKAEQNSVATEYDNSTQNYARTRSHNISAV
jgi:hypothetical protein